MITTRTSLHRLRTLAYISNLSTSAVAAGWQHMKPESGDKESPVNRSSPFVAPPATMAWSQHLHNTVSLIGTVKFTPKHIAGRNGRVGAYTVLLVKPRPTSLRHFSVILSFWDLLAKRALAHLKSNDYIYISGELGSYTKSTSEETERFYYKVSAKELIYVQVPDESYLEAGECLEQKRMKRFRLWQSLFANPDEWDDYRKIKKSTVHPDFRHKKTRERLWLNADDPSWIKEHLVLLDSRPNETLNVELPFGSFTSNCVSSHQLASSDSTETGSLNPALGRCSNIGESLEQKHMRMLPLWRSLFANPDEWHDCRKTKKHCRQPDFIHKKTNEALWLNPEDPSWVKKHVELLDSELTEIPSAEMPFGSFTSDCVSGQQLASSYSAETDLLNGISNKK